MPDLTPGQFQLVYNLLSLTVATMLAAGLFFYGSRAHVAHRYRPALLVSAIVVWIAGYHYFRIFQSWEGAFMLSGEGAYTASGAFFNDAYRYADWLITVPLLLVELVAVMALAKDEARSLLTKLVIAAVLMIAFGYPGEVSDNATTKWVWWAAAMVPYLYIYAALFSKMGPVIAANPGRVGSLLGLARNVLIVTWLFYPISFLAPVLGLGGATGEVFLQVGYTIADITAKAGFGVVIYMIAAARTEQEGHGATTEPLAA
ncbi:Green-light absorbing proteorhodopsin precursor [Planctomycetes bacterium Poly30]|uniref:Green-light absorbing proteorhodopsin n=1 Tax=Saltatorellus ferox TaxID=2528018 RepID=A0A518EPB9_9BACT|nr:Green-light absorbing proteorhodopsin precursor [Planctomycetes bacterium Poly30]